MALLETTGFAYLMAETNNIYLNKCLLPTYYLIAVKTWITGNDSHVVDTGHVNGIS